MSITKTLDTLAQEWYGEFGFSTCTSEEQDVIVNYVFKQQQEQKSKNK
jgi:hypothetical protein|tara:strand:+ start:1166 stop:1309 length:144 start_codon:yes stop_codon:yes gene_type:complete